MIAPRQRESPAATVVGIAVVDGAPLLLEAAAVIGVAVVAVDAAADSAGKSAACSGPVAQHRTVLAATEGGVCVESKRKENKLLS